MANGKYTRVDGRRSASSYCSTVTITVFVALCLVGVWMMTSSSSSSVVPVQNVDEPAQEKKSEAKEQLTESNESSSNQQFEDNNADLPEDATKGGKNEKIQENIEKSDEKSNEESKFDDGSNRQMQNDDNKTGDGDSKTDSEGGETNTDESEKKSYSDENGNKSDSDDGEKKSDRKSEESSGEKVDGQVEEKEDQNENKESEKSSDDKKEDGSKNQSSNELFPSGAQLELTNETTTQKGSFSTQATESKNEKEAQQSSNQQNGYNWKLCNVTAGADFIPCLDNLQAIKKLRSTKHYEHRERHCPEEPPTCLVPLPEGYKRSIEWPTSREKIWYYNVPHTKLAKIKGHQNWVKVTGEYLTFPGGGTQFKNGALHYIDFIQESVPDVAWGKRTRVVLDVGCGVASFGGFLFDRGVLSMSFAPKDEHEAQVQFALERGIPAISAVMGTERLPFPGIVFDAVHCARCRVPWHIEGGKLLLELNRVLRPGGFFIWSATPVYQKLPEDVEIWNAMSQLIKAMCWELVSISKDTINKVGIAVYRKPTSNECYEKRSQQQPPVCSGSDDPNAAWHVPLQACMHKVPEESLERGSQWPEQWPARLEKTPYWLLSSQVGVYGKSAPEDFTADYEHWKRVVSKSYLNGMGINWSTVRNVMDMRSVYGGFAAAMKDISVWVMNVISIDSPDTLPIIYERGLFEHELCYLPLPSAEVAMLSGPCRCNLVAVVAEVDRILRPEGKLIVRDDVETINELESMVKGMQWEVRMTYSKDKEGLLCVEKSMWRPKELETIKYAIA
ncbi:putative methyltransferase PMT26 [Citrus sinensis]|uniref:Methyltransferase PMT26 n=1 Tax=Citrus sinensis TaxID=2711 RepID=A0ACB8JJB4_CITSI|nr:putative methyltransferase PMT26 [Citrus sinensis]